MTNYHHLVPLPNPKDVNTGLHSPTAAQMLGLFGRPGNLTPDCSPVTNEKMKKTIVTVLIHPHLNVTGWAPAVHSLVDVMADVRKVHPDLADIVETAGMLCCRAIRNDDVYSNHSWGCAIDLRIASQLDQLASGHCQQGMLDLYGHFHKHGWYWGGGYHGRKDPMHFEVAWETVQKMYKALYK